MFLIRKAQIDTFDAILLMPFFTRVRNFIVKNCQPEEYVHIDLDKQIKMQYYNAIRDGLHNEQEVVRYIISRIFKNIS